MISARIKGLSPYKTEKRSAKVKLSSNELSLDLPAEVKEEIARAVARIPFNRYPDPQATELKEAVALRFGVDPSCVVLGNGSDELIQYLCMAVGESGDAVFYPVPTFPMYGISAQTVGKERLEVPLGEDLDIDLDSSLKEIRRRKPVLAFFSYPNNPTGNCFDKNKITAIRNEGVFCVIDEAYYHFSGKTFLEEALSREDTVVLRTLSKIGMAGLRVGVLIARQDVADYINRMRLPFNITYPSQVIAVLMLTKFYHFVEEAVNTVKRERDRLMDALRSMKGVEVFPSEANFFLFRTPLPAPLLQEKLLEEGVLVRDVSYLPRLERCLRVSIGKPEENDAFLEALHKVIGKML